MNRPDRSDEPIDRLLRQSLRGPAGDASGSCLDAETIAAWLDGSLSGTALEDAQAHAADCPRCRAVIGTVIQTAAPSAQPAPRRRWLGWLVPVAAAAAAVAIWVAVRPGGQTATTMPAEVTREAYAAKTPEAAPPAQAPQPASTAQPSTAAPSTPPAAPAPQSPSRLQADRTMAAKSQPEPAPPANTEPAAAASAAARVGGAGGIVGGAAVASPPPAAQDETRAQSPAGGGSAPRTLFAGAAVVVPSPDPSIRWRISGPSVERTTDGGTNWSPVFTGTAQLAAGSAPSASTCWIVGQSGTVLLSADGRTFTPVPLPDRVDLTGVQATDARTASVHAADGGTWVTADGGRSWERR